jgi:hypothetical protein
MVMRKEESEMPDLSRIKNQELVVVWGAESRLSPPPHF